MSSRVEAKLGKLIRPNIGPVAAAAEQDQKAVAERRADGVATGAFSVAGDAMHTQNMGVSLSQGTNLGPQNKAAAAQLEQIRRTPSRVRSTSSKDASAPSKFTLHRRDGNYRHAATTSAAAKTSSPSSLPSSSFLPVNLESASSNGGITTSDDDFQLASDLLLRMSKSAISLQDQICSAAFMGNREVVETLIRRGVSVNAFGMGGWTPLHEAVNAGHHDLVEFLCNHGADPIGVVSNASNKTAIQLAIDAKDPVLVDIMHQSLNAMKTKHILSLEKQLVEMQNEYKRLFKSIATSATRKKKNKTKRARNSERKGKSGGNGSGGRERVTYSSQSDLSEGFWSNSEGGGGDVSAISADPVGADAGTNAPPPAILLPSKLSTRTSPTSLETTSFSSLRDWSPASPTRSQRSHAKYPIVRKQYALRDIQTFLFMLHNKRFELLNDAISLWKGFLFHDRQARPVFLHPGSLARRQRELELVSPSQSSSSGTGGGIRSWLQRGYKGGVNNSRPNIGDGRNFDEHVGAHTGERTEITSLNALMGLIHEDDHR